MEPVLFVKIALLKLRTTRRPWKGNCTPDIIKQVTTLIQPAQKQPSKKGHIFYAYQPAPV